MDSPLETDALQSYVRDLATGGREITGTRELRRKVSFHDLVNVVEEVRGERCGVFMNRSDWARPLLL